MKHFIKLVVLAIIGSAIALAGQTSCVSGSGGSGCPQVDSAFSNDPPLVINNNSFEFPACTGGTCNGGDMSIDQVNSWTGTNSFGVADSTGAGGTTPEDALQVAYLDSGSTLFQDINNASNAGNGPGGINGGVIAANTTYVFTVYIGERADAVPGTATGLPDNYGIELVDYNTGTTISTVIAINQGCGPNAPNAFQTCLISVDTGAMGFAGTIGDDLEVELFANGTTGQVLYDNAALGYTQDVPEPGTVGLALLGLSALAVMRRRAARSRS